MESRTTIMLSIIVIAAFGIISAASVLGSGDAFAQKHGHHGKSCPQHGCKGTHGYYTEKGHHHCFKNSEGCYSKHH